ncbi:hypothetical protein PVK06_003549 [Gossypium arboreum]|uniref:Uncharacterized protein n=1 Tax=Gossypium arboreum TaxID=29729 RepID=A0ABR0R6X0_GOSAR|nr:hypothetical protein PVK06_003549 [Gossypium arboreum]
MVESSNGRRPNKDSASRERRKWQHDDKRKLTEEATTMMKDPIFLVGMLRRWMPQGNPALETAFRTIETFSRNTNDGIDTIWPTQINQNNVEIHEFETFQTYLNPESSKNMAASGGWDMDIDSLMEDLLNCSYKDVDKNKWVRTREDQVNDSRKMSHHRLKHGDRRGEERLDIEEVERGRLAGCCWPKARADTTAPASRVRRRKQVSFFFRGFGFES